MHGQMWPSPATAQASVLANDWLLFGTAGLAVAVIVWGLILFSVFRWRRKGQTEGPLPPQFDTNNPLEIAWTAIPLLIVLALFVYTYRAEADVERLAPKPDVIVDVNAYQWNWTFAYQGGPTVQGSFADPPQLVLPLGETVRIVLTSSDVDHAFWVPDFLFKRDAIPGHPTSFDLNPSKLGTYLGRCAEFCGFDHALMDFSVRVVSSSDFNRWRSAHHT